MSEKELLTTAQEKMAKTWSRNYLEINNNNQQVKASANLLLN